jgi:hypothetical protein
MKKSIYLVIMIMALPLFSFAQWPEEVTIIESVSNDSVVAQSDLSYGRVIEDLSWASSSSNACFVATQNRKYMGNHVFFATTIPPKSVMTISVTPGNSKADLSIYAYMNGQSEYRLVPDLPRCITCEADYKWDGTWKNRVQTQERKVEFNNPSNNTYSILIGVSGPKEAVSGQFEVKIKLKS